MIVRELQGEYAAGVGGRAIPGPSLGAATDTEHDDRAGVERIMRFAFRLAQSRPRKHHLASSQEQRQRHAMVIG